MDLKTLQYPRHVHKGGTFRIVNSPAECDAAMDEGWVLSPDDPPRAHVGLPEAEIEVLSDTTSPEGEPSLTEQTTPRKRAGRPKKASSEASDT